MLNSTTGFVAGQNLIFSLWLANSTDGGASWDFHAFYFDTRRGCTTYFSSTKVPALFQERSLMDVAPSPERLMAASPDTSASPIMAGAASLCGAQATIVSAVDASRRDAATAAFYLTARRALRCDRRVRSRFHRLTKSKKEPILIVRPILFCSKAIMQRGILRSCALFILAVLCVHTSLSPVAAQQPQQTREGIITTFAPLVEKVAPSVVTVSTTQTVSRGLTAYPFSDDTLRQFFGGRSPQRQDNRRYKASARA